MTNKTIEKKFEEFLWGIQLTVRYHHHRRSFYDFWHRTTTFLIILLGSSTIASVFASKPAVALSLSAAITVLSTISLVFSLNENGRLHFYLAKRFIELEKKIRQAEENPTESALTELTHERLTIESEEPPVMKIVYDYCYNEMLQKEGSKEEKILEFKWYHFLTKNITNFGFESVKTREQTL